MHRNEVDLRKEGVFNEYISMAETMQQETEKALNKNFVEAVREQLDRQMREIEEE